MKTKENILRIGDRVTVQLRVTEIWENQATCNHALIDRISNNNKSVHIQTDELTTQLTFNVIESGLYMIDAYKITKE